MGEQIGDPAAGAGFVADQAGFDGPFQALRIGVGADRQGRAGQLQQADELQAGEGASRSARLEFVDPGNRAVGAVAGVVQVMVVGSSA
jgi:hypothetical protein